MKLVTIRRVHFTEAGSFDESSGWTPSLAPTSPTSTCAEPETSRNLYPLHYVAPVPRESPSERHDSSLSFSASLWSASSSPYLSPPLHCYIPLKPSPPSLNPDLAPSSPTPPQSARLIHRSPSSTLLDPSAAHLMPAIDPPRSSDRLDTYFPYIYSAFLSHTANDA